MLFLTRRPASRRVARTRLLAILTAFLGSSGLILTSSCGDIAGVQADRETLHDTITVFALTGAPPTLETAVNTLLATAVAIDPNGQFDLAVDINSQGRAVFYPTKLVVQPLIGVHEVGIQKVAGSFASLTRAPTGTYARDSAVVVLPGEVIAVEAVRQQGGDLCAFALSPNIYSKIGVDSVSVARKMIYLKVSANPNCGFRSFLPGLPKD